MHEFRRQLRPLAAFTAVWVLMVMAGLSLPKALGKPPGAGLGLVTPYGQGVDRVVRAGQDKGWTKVALALRQMALEAYRNGEEPTEQWYFLYRWSRLFAKNKGGFINAWIEHINRSRLGHANMTKKYPHGGGVLGDLLSAELKIILLKDIAFSREFFGLLNPADNLVESFKILESLYREYPVHFKKYLRLAVALSIVYDVSPPPGWPHNQVPGRMLPRHLPEVSAAFEYWKNLNEKRLSAHNLTLLTVEKLKFLVDTPAAFDELRWAHQNVKERAGEFAQVYSSVAYRHDRVEQNRFVWNGPDYRLPTILKNGGICVDQAYFASQSGKAKGIPTLIFRGAGLTGRHAWFGYLQPSGRWEFDAGRYGENRYVTGYAHDPQTWADISDHDLAFLSEGFRHTHYYIQSVFHSNFAFEFLTMSDLDAARQAAEKALRFERRNQQAWEILVETTRRTSDDPRDVESILRRAVRVFGNYPDLETYYLNRVNESLVARGELSRARLEKGHVVSKNKAERMDLSIQEAARILKESSSKDPLHVQLRQFRVILIQFGKAGGMDVFDRIVYPFVHQLARAGHRREARSMAQMARQRLNPPEGSMLDQSLDKLIQSVKN